MRPVNLIPLNQRRGNQAPLRAGVASYAVVAVLALALVGAVLIVLADNKVTENEATLAQLEQRQAVANQAAAELAPYGQFAALSQSRNATIVSLAHSRFDWERVLSELALVIPEDVWLETLAGSATAAQATADPAAASTSAAPTLQITGCANGQEGVARFLAALRDIDGVTRVGMQRSQLGSSAEGGAPAAASDSAAGSAGGSCQTREFIASFDISISFDAVPASALPAAPVTTDAAPALTDGTAAPATTETTDAPPTDDGGVAATEAEQQTAVDAAEAQSAEAQDSAEAVGVAK